MSFLLVDGQGIALFGLQSIISKEFPQTTCHISHDVGKAIQLIGKNNYSLVVMELNMPGENMHAVIERILSIKPDQPIMIYTASPESIYATRLLQLGVKGFVNKGKSTLDFLIAVRAILHNGLYMSNQLMEKISNDYLFNRTSSPFDKLSGREMEVCHFMIKGYALSEIAAIMNLHKSTIGTHRARVLGKLGVRGIVDLRDLAAAHGIPLRD